MWKFTQRRVGARKRSTWAFAIVIAALSLLDLLTWVSLWSMPNAISNVLLGTARPLVSQAAPATFTVPEAAKAFR